MNRADEILSTEFDKLVDMAEAHIRKSINRQGKKARGTFTIGTSLTGSSEYADIPFPLEKADAIRAVAALIGDYEAALKALKSETKQYDVFFVNHKNGSNLGFQFYDTIVGCFQLKTAKLFIKKLTNKLSDTNIKFSISKDNVCTLIRVKYHS